MYKIFEVYIDTYNNLKINILNDLLTKYNIQSIKNKGLTPYSLAYSNNLQLSSFEYPNKQQIDTVTIFQSWAKSNANKIKKDGKKTCKSFIKIYSLSNGGTAATTKNKNMLHKCDVYLPLTCFNNMKSCTSFEALPNKQGYGIVFLKEHIMLYNLFYFTIDWEKEAFLSTNSALNLSFSSIEKAVIKHGIVDS